jgi:hypothetical protein
MWYLLLESIFDTDHALADLLWQHLPRSGPVAWELGTIEQRAHGSHEAIMKRTRRLASVLTPQMLFQASTALAPEGTARPAEIIRFERAVLALTTKTGEWRW